MTDNKVEGSENLAESTNLGSHVSIAQGVIHQLKQWPSYLFSASLAGCLLIFGVICFILIVLMFGLSGIIQSECHWDEKAQTSDERFKVYFVKHENKTWSYEELCYIESAARRHPEIHFRMIHLLDKNFHEESARQGERITRTNFGFTGKYFGLMKEQDFQLATARGKLYLARNQMVSNNFNVEYIDAPIEEFFQESVISNGVDKLDQRMLEIAAGAYSVWNLSGIALSPNLYCTLDNIKGFLRQNGTESNCSPNEFAIFDLKGDFQASGVPCQIFVGFLLNEIAKIPIENTNNTVERILNKFCHGLHDCAEVKILDPQPKCSLNPSECPSVRDHLISR